MKRPLALALAVALSVSIAACSSATSSSSTPASASASTTPSTTTSSSPSTASPSPTASATSQGKTDLDGAITRMKSVSFAEGEQSTPDFPNLVGSYRFSSIRAELDTGVERVILKAEGDGDLQWQAQWVSEATTQGKGDVIDVAGKSILQVMVAGVRYPEEGEDEELLAALPTTKLITDIQAEPVFEGMQQIVIGTKEEVPYRVYFDEQTGYLLIEFQS